MVTAPEKPIPAEMFSPVPTEQGFWPFKAYPKKIAAITTLEQIQQHLGVTTNRLSALLGMETPRSVFRWLAGESSPSAYYLTLMIELIILSDTKQIDLRLVRSIDWTTGEIFNKAGLHDKGRHSVPPGQRKMPDGRIPERTRLSGFLAESF